MEEFNRLADLEREKTRFHLREEERREEQIKRAADDDGIELATTYLGITQSIEERIAQLEAKLDRYDAAIVQALTENETDLRRARDLEQRLLLEAHTLPDGRRVFRTRDGAQVFDEHGAEVSEDVIAANDIAPQTPAWETFQEANQRRIELERERQDIIDYQERIDGIRERMDESDATAQELSDLEREMEVDRPDRLTAQLNAQNRDAHAALTPERYTISPSAGFTP